MINSELLNKLKIITPEEEKILKGQKNIDRTIYMEKEDNVVINAKVLGEGKLITVRPHTRFVHFPRHSHDYIEIVYMCSGSTTHIVDGDRVDLKKGELLFLCQSAVQEILPASEDDIAVNFIVMPEFFDQTLKMMGEEDTPLKSFIVDCLKNKHSKASYLHFKVSDVLPIQNLLENLIWVLLNGTPNKRSINQITMGLVFLQLINCTERLVQASTDEDITVKVLSYIEENYKSGSLKELADTLHYDISSISREIKNKTGKTYTELLWEKRLSQSCFLLKNTNMTVDKIALNVGYENISYFYRLFKKRYGISPKKYRD